MTDTHPLRLLTATFNLPLQGSDIPVWRDAFIAMAGLESDLFVSNENSLQSAGAAQIVAYTLANGKQPWAKAKTTESTTETFPYSYPLVHYRSIRGKAAIFAMNEGIFALHKVLVTTNWEINWEGQPMTLQLEGLEMKDHYLQLTKEMRPYRLRRWLPFDDDNYQRWLNAPDLHARVDLLEMVLSEQLLNFCKGVGFKLLRHFDLRLLHLHATKQLHYPDEPCIALDVTYCTNILLPPGLAVGKAVSDGFGCQYPARDQ